MKLTTNASTFVFVNVYWIHASVHMFSADGKVNGNPIGWLQELCMARRWPPPFYETQSEIGLPHERFFTIACHVSTYIETGRGKSKKEAKRLAAHQMWQRLQDLPADSQDDATDEVSILLYFYACPFTSSHNSLNLIEN